MTAARLRSPRLALALALFASFASVALRPGAVACAAEPDGGALLEQKSPAVVTLKFVLKVKLSMSGQSQEEEQHADARGVVVEPSGLVMLASDSFEPAAAALLRRSPGRGIEVTATPKDFKVLFGSDAKEHDAVLVATEKKIGLAFVQIVTPEGTLASVDLTKGAPCSVGQSLVGVTRKSRGFDSAAVFERTSVAGKIEKPRPMWALERPTAYGLPLFDGDGRPVGVVTNQQGVEGADESGQSQNVAALLLSMKAQGEYLLPLDAVLRTVEQAKKRVPEAVAKAKEGTDSKPEPGMGEAAKPASPEAGPGSGSGGEPSKPPEAPKSPDAPKPPDAPQPPDVPKTPEPK